MPVTALSRSAAPRRILVVGDIHWACKDEAAWEAFEQFRQAWNPDEIFCLGDAVEFRGISHFTNVQFDAAGNLTLPPRDELRAEIEGVRQMFMQWRKDHPAARLHFLCGNHEDRLAKYVATRAPDLMSLPGAFSIPALFDLNRAQVGWSGYRQGVVLPYGPRGILLTHGSFGSAQTELNCYRRPGISGHLHKYQQAQYRDWDGLIVRWIVQGCLADLNPTWCALPHWEHGFTAIEWWKDQNFWVARHIGIHDGILQFRTDELSS